MHQIVFPLGLCPRTHWGSLQHSPEPLAVLGEGGVPGKGKKEEKAKEKGEGGGRKGRGGVEKGKKRGEEGREGMGEGRGGKGRGGGGGRVLLETSPRLCVTE